MSPVRNFQNKNFDNNIKMREKQRKISNGTKATAIAHSIQGLIKYHGLKNKKLRLPYHDSISVCIKELFTITTVERSANYKKDIFIINRKEAEEKETLRMRVIINKIREIAKDKKRVKVVSENRIGNKIYSYKIGKGLGFSASGGAALAAAAAKAFGLDYLLEDLKTLSTIARRLAGSAARSTVGGFARWYASEKDEKSYAKKLASPKDFPDFRMIIYPLKAEIKTDSAHSEAETSPLFPSRLNYINSMLEEMEKAIKEKDIEKIGTLAEKDSFVLHAVTMTGNSHLFLLKPESILIYKKIKELREKGIKAYISWDTGPSTFINTTIGNVDVIIRQVSKIININPIVSEIGNEVRLINKHLF